MQSTTYDSAMTEVTSGTDGVRERILDAATECLIESGIDARLHATIAERAGVSRPTVYKYVGDQTAILRAVLDREVERFFAAATPAFTAMNEDESRGWTTRSCSSSTTPGGTRCCRWRCIGTPV